MTTASMWVASFVTTTSMWVASCVTTASMWVASHPEGEEVCYPHDPRVGVKCATTIAEGGGDVYHPFVTM